MTQIRLPHPHAGQKAVRRQEKRFNWLAAGRRWRKTTLVMSICVEAALKGGTYIWGAPTFDQARIGFEETRYACGGAVDFNISRMMATFPRYGGRIVFRSLDTPDNARGWSANGVAIDEAGAVKPQAWYEVLRPMLIDTGGWFWGVGTPLGRNWFWHEHLAARESDDSMAWHIPVLGVKITENGLVRDPNPLENPDIDFKEIEQLYRTMPERVFRQEILAEFTEDGGGVFRRVSEAATATPQERAIEGHQYIFGIDWAKMHDFTCIAVLDTTINELCYLDRFNQIDYAVQVGRLKALYERFRPERIIAERNSIGEPLLEQLQRDGLPVQVFQTTNATKATAIEALALAFERSELKIIDDPVLLAELQAYEIDRLPSGMVRYSAPSGMHDDSVVATALAWHGGSTGFFMWPMDEDDWDSD